MPFISFSCLTALAWNSTVMLDRSGENRHSYLFPGLRGKAVSLLPWSLMLAVDFVGILYQVKEIPLFLVFIMKGSWIFSNAISASVHLIMQFFLFGPEEWWITSYEDTIYMQGLHRSLVLQFIKFNKQHLTCTPVRRPFPSSPVSLQATHCPPPPCFVMFILLLLLFSVFNLSVIWAVGALPSWL